MIVKILSLFLMMFVLMGFSGCTTKTEYVYVDRVSEVKVPVKCVIKVPTCDNTKVTYTGLVTEMRLCINRLSEAAELCNK